VRSLLQRYDSRMRPQSPSIRPFEGTGVSFWASTSHAPGSSHVGSLVAQTGSKNASLAIDPALHVIEVQRYRCTAPELLPFLKKGSLMPQKVTMIALASALTGLLSLRSLPRSANRSGHALAKGGPLSRGQFLLSGSPHGRHQSAVSSRAPGLDRQAGGWRATGG
jgi:hypothetical protein